MLNQVFIMGHLGQDPDLKYGSSGNPICNFSVATDEGYTDKDGNKVDRTEWHRIVAYQRQAETCSEYLKKGSLVLVIGKLQTRKWQDQDGNDRYMTEIVANRVQFLNRKSGDDEQQTQHQKQGRITEKNLGPAFPSEAGGMSDVPF